MTTETTIRHLPVLTATQLRAWRACQRRHFIRFTRRYVPVVTATVLYFGTLAHKALEAWWRAWMTAHGDEALAMALGIVSEDPFITARLHAMLVGYDRRWRAYAESVIVLDVEAGFRCALVNPASGRPSRTYELAGKMDVVVVEHDGTHAVIEHKTTSEDAGEGSEYRDRLALDGQVSQYFIGAQARGWPVTRTIYDVLVKPGQRPLKATGKIELKKDGTPKAGQRLEDETAQEFRARLDQMITEDPDRFYHHIPLERSADAQAEYLQDVWQSGIAIHQSELTGCAPRNPDSCHLYGQTCDFWAVCVGKASLDDEALFRRLDDPHPELRLLAAAAAAPTASTTPATSTTEVTP